MDPTAGNLSDLHGSSGGSTLKDEDVEKTAERQAEDSAKQYLVNWDGPQDPNNPQNWTTTRKLTNVAFYIWSTVASTFSSATLSPAVTAIAHRFGISREVATLATSSLFLAGYSVGPLLWAPLSELKGRKLPTVIAMFGLCIFAAAGATAKDTQTLMLCRFFEGVMGNAPLVITSGVVADTIHPLKRSYIMSTFATTVFMGPMIAPFISGFTIQNKSLGWRWTEWWGFFFGLVGLLGLVFISRESLPQALLAKKAAAVRRTTGNWAYHAKSEENEVDLQTFVRKYLKRPLEMVFTEPILLLISIYTAFVYALLYTFLTSYTLVFLNGYGMSPGISGLPFFGIALGIFVGFVTNLSLQPYFIRKTIRNRGVFTPEWLMPFCFAGAVAFPIGLFWFGWTAAYPRSVHWIVPTASGLFTGFGLVVIFMMQFTYLIVVYKENSASAFGGNTIIRSALAAGFPLFATQMFENLGVNWASTLLGCIAVLLIPVPVVFYYFGAKIRTKSRFVS